MRILLIDDYDDIREVLSLILQGIYDCEIVEKASGNSAINLLKQDQKFDLVISDYNMPDGNGGKVYTYLRENKIQIPFILLSSDGLDTHSEFDSKILLDHVSKPFTDDIIETIINRLLKTPKPNKEVQKYLGIPIGLLSKIKDLRHSLYLKISEDKYVKVLTENALFDEEEFKRFKDKNVQYLYLEKQYIGDFFIIYQKSMLSEEAFSKMTIDTSLDTLNANVDMVKGFSEQLGWSQEVVELANKNVQLAMTIVSKSTDPFAVLKKLSAKNESYYATHSSLAALGSIALLQKLGWNQDFAKEKLALAAILHDMPLNSIELQNKRNFLNVLNLKEYQGLAETKAIIDHPTKAYEVACQMPLCHPEAAKIILQHHEQPDGSGFPNKLKAHDIHKLTAVFIVVEEVVDYYLENPDDNNVLDHLIRIKDRYSSGNFAIVWEALYKSCLANKEKQAATKNP